MAAVLYLLCAGTALLCTLLLFRGHRRMRVPLLFWVGLFFAGFSLHNFLLFVDRILLPTVDLALLRSLVELVSVLLLLFGMIWKTK